MVVHRKRNMCLVYSELLNDNYLEMYGVGEMLTSYVEKEMVERMIEKKILVICWLQEMRYRE